MKSTEEDIARQEHLKQQQEHQEEQGGPTEEDLKYNIDTLSKQLENPKFTGINRISTERSLKENQEELTKLKLTDKLSKSIEDDELKLKVITESSEPEKYKSIEENIQYNKKQIEYIKEIQNM